MSAAALAGLFIHDDRADGAYCCDWDGALRAAQKKLASKPAVPGLDPLTLSRLLIEHAHRSNPDGTATCDCGGVVSDWAIHFYTACQAAAEKRRS